MRPRRFLARAVPPLAVAVSAIGLWQAAVWLWQLPPILLPPPAQVAEAAWEYRFELVRGTGITALAALSGLGASLAIGSMIAVVFSQSKAVRDAFFPYVIFLQTVPIVAIAPLLITWSGYRPRTVVLVAMIISLFPVVSNVTAGLLAIDRNLHDLFRLYGASRWRTLLRLRLPTAVRYLALSARISSGLAVIGAIVGEFFVGNGSSYDGLGTLMTRWQAMSQTDALMAAVAASTILGMAMFVGVNAVAATALRRWMGAGKETTT